MKHSNLEAKAMKYKVHTEPQTNPQQYKTESWILLVISFRMSLE